MEEIIIEEQKKSGFLGKVKGKLEEKNITPKKIAIGAGVVATGIVAGIAAKKGFQLVAAGVDSDDIESDDELEVESDGWIPIVPVEVESEKVEN